MREHRAWYIPGPMLILGNLVAGVAAVLLIWQSAVHKGATSAVLAVIGTILAIAFFIVFRGIIVVAPGAGPGRAALRQVQGHRSASRGCSS